MALFRRSITSLFSVFSARKSPTVHNNLIQILLVGRNFEHGRRYLFSSEILGLENYTRQKASMTEKMGIYREKFFKRMDEYMTASDTNTIFTDDLRTMVYFTETENELDVAVKMLKRFHLQNKDLRFSNFVFGPLVMRLLYLLKKPDLAFQLFTDQSLNEFFDQMSSFIVLMDLLYENKQYDRVLTTMAMVKDKQLNGYKFPMDCVTLTVAACYQMNTEDSFKTMITLLKETGGSMSSISMRSAIYGSMLALKQGKAEVALELLSMTSIKPMRNLPVAYINAKVLIFVSLGRTEEAVEQLKAIVQQDVPDHVLRAGQVFEEVLKEVRTAVKKGSKELIHQLEVTEKALKDGGHIATGQQFEEYLQRPILRQRKLQDGYKQRERTPVGGFKRYGGNQSFSRPGLLD